MNPRYLPPARRRFLLCISAPGEAKIGSRVRVSIDLPRTPAAIHVVHVDVLDPNGQRVLYYSGNILANGGHAMKLLPLAYNDAAGIWTLRIHDLLSGQCRNIQVKVE